MQIAATLMRLTACAVMAVALSNCMSNQDTSAIVVEVHGHDASCRASVEGRPLKLPDIAPTLGTTGERGVIVLFGADSSPACVTHTVSALRSAGFESVLTAKWYGK